MITRDAAAYLGVSHNYLRNMRQDLLGPAWSYKMVANQRVCWYNKDDLDTWKKQHKFRGIKWNYSTSSLSTQSVTSPIQQPR